MIHLTFFGRNDTGALGDAQDYSTLTPTLTAAAVATTPLGATAAYIVSTTAVLISVGALGQPFYVPADEPFLLDVIEGQVVYGKSLA